MQIASSLGEGWGWWEWGWALQSVQVADYLSGTDREIPD